MKPKIAIIGRGNVGSALERGARRAGYEVKTAGHDAREVKDTAAWGELVVLAVPFKQIDETLRELEGAAEGKVLVDVTNALDDRRHLAVGFTTSGAEELQKKAPNARVVKAFNTVFAKHMDSGKTKGKSLGAFVASDHADAKQQVLALARDIGFDAIDAGPLEAARSLEPLAYLNIQLGYAQKLGTDIGFELVH